MKRFIAIVLAVMLGACSSPTGPGGSKSSITGVTITGSGVTGSLESKELTVVIGTPVDLSVEIVKSGNPSVTETWSSADETLVSVGVNDGVVNGLVATTDGVVVTVNVGGKTDTVLVKVVETTPGLVLEFDTDKLEFQTIAATVSTVPPTVTKTGSVIYAKNTDGTFKNTSGSPPFTLQGSSYLLYKTPITGDFEVKAAVKVTGVTTGSDKYSAQVGMFTANTDGMLALDLKAATIAKRSHSSAPGIRSLYTKSNTTDQSIGAGNPSVTLTNDTMSEYHILSTKRVGNVLTFEQNGVSATVNIDPDANQDGIPDTNLGAWPTLAGAVKAGIGFSGVTIEVEGFVINTLNGDGSVNTELYKLGNMPNVTIAVSSITLTGPGGAADTSASLDLNGVSLPLTHQLTTGYVPASATVGNSVTYGVSAGDSNVTVNAGGLVSITGAGDGSATVTATSGNGKTAAYTFTLTDSSQVVTSIAIPSTLDIAVGQNKTLSPVTVLPASAPDKSVTWSSNSAAILVNTTTGAITVASGTAVGTTGVVKATSVANSGVVSNDCTVTVVAATTTTKTWNFQTLPSGWVENTNTVAGLANVDYGQGLTLTTSTRTMKIVTTQAVPSTGGSAFSVGCLQPGGAGVFANLGTIGGAFTITINYSAAGASNRYPAILVDGVDVTSSSPATASTGTTDGQSFTYNYTGAGGVVTISSMGNALRVFDLSLTN